MIFRNCSAHNIPTPLVRLASDRSEIKIKVDNAYISGDALADRINSAFSGLDIKGEIEKSIQSHNRVSEIDEINSYNAARIKSYKLNQDTSVFGDFKL